MNSRLQIGTQVQWTCPYISNPKEKKRSGMIVYYAGKYPIVLLDPEGMKLEAGDPESIQPFTGKSSSVRQRVCDEWRKERGIVLDDNDNEVYEDHKDEGYD